MVDDVMRYAGVADVAVGDERLAAGREERREPCRDEHREPPAAVGHVGKYAADPTHVDEFLMDADGRRDGRDQAVGDLIGAIKVC